MTSQFLWVRSLAVGLLSPLLVVSHEAAITCWPESVVASEDSSGEGSMSELTSWLLAALSCFFFAGRWPEATPNFLLPGSLPAGSLHSQSMQDEKTLERVR